MSAQYVTKPLFGETTLLLRTDATWRSKMRFDANPNIATLIPAFAPFEFSPASLVMNARVALQNIEFSGAKFEVAAWARNLTDNKAPTYGLGFSDYLRSASYQPARTVGVDVIFRY